MRRMVAPPALIAGLLVFTWTSPALAQVQYQTLQQMHHTSWSATDGLTGDPITLTQTSDGFLWIGTNNGLFRFDGVQFERFQPDSGSLPAVGISALGPAPDGGLWVGYINGGISLITASGAITSYTTADSVPIGQVRSIVVDHEGAVWVAAIGGLARLESGRWHKIRMDWNYPCKSAWTLFLERDGTLWVGAASPDRLVYLPPGTRRFVDIGADHSALEFIQVDDTTIGYSHLLEEEVRFLRRTPGGATEFQVVKDIPAFAIALDGEGGLWFAGYDISRRQLKPDPASRTQGFIAGPIERVRRSGDLVTGLSRDVLVDREGTVWAVTAQGLDRFRRRNLTWVQDTMMQFGATMVTDQSGEIWLLARSTPSIRRLRDGMVLPGAPEDVSTGMLDSHGTVWLTPPNELLRWKDGQFTPVPPPREVVQRGLRFAVIATAEDSSGRLWASVGGSGVFYWKDQQWTFVPVLPNRTDWAPVDIAVDRENRVWLAYVDEVAMVKDGVVRIMSQSADFKVGPLEAFATRDRQLWVGGELGLALLNGENFHTVQMADGAELGAVHDIIPTEDGVWLGTGNGIVHIPGTEVEQLAGNPTYRVRCEVFDLESDLPDGLSLYRFGARAIEGRDGILRFSTNQGIASIDPRQIVRNRLPPSVIIRGVTADDRQYRPSQALTLPPLTRTIRIEYTASSLAIPGRVRFRHRLEGWDEQWHDAGTRREVFYTNLGPGRYVLRVMASNNDGVWNETGATLRFMVAPAWYQTVRFQTLVALAVIAAIVLAYRARVRRVATALSARFEERLAERTRIARDLHDTLLQTVQASRIVAEHALRFEDPKRLRQGMEQLTDWLGQAVKEGRGAVQTLRDSAVASHHLAEALSEAANYPGRPAEVTVSVKVHGVPRELHPITRDEIYRIGYEAIRNVYTHARASQLDILIEYGHEFTLRIADNGIGISPAVADAVKSGHFGLHGMRERAETIGATLTIAGGSTGTTIHLLVPGRKAFRSQRLSRSSTVPP